jgi:excisionase family DNA binding protein
MSELIYTTGDVAKFTGVNFRTVIRWIERGELSGYKLPGRGDHRVMKSSLVRFMRNNGMPIPLELSGMERKALVVDDDVPMANAIARVLKREGWQVEVANDGFEAGMLLVGFQPSLLTLDLRMPSMDGLTVLALTRANPELEDLKILVISAQGRSDLNKALAGGANQVLAKPFDNQERLSIVEGWFGSQSKDTIKTI